MLNLGNLAIGPQACVRENTGTEVIRLTRSDKTKIEKKIIFFRFRRKLETCDLDNDIRITNDTFRFGNLV